MKFMRVILLVCMVGSAPVNADTLPDIYKAVKQGNVALVADHIASFPFDKILAYAAKIEQKEVCQLLLQIKGEASIHQNFFEGLQYKKNQKLPLSATEALFLKWSLLRSGDLAVNVAKIDKVNRGYTGFHAMVQKVRDVEDGMRSKGYHTFVHGRNWEWNFVNDVWNLICALQENSTQVGDKVVLRYRDKEIDVPSLYDFRKDLLDNGVYGVISGTLSQGKEAEVIFMNRTPLSNIQTWGECSGRYFIQNHSVRGSTPGLDFALQLLKKYGLQSFEQKIKNVHALHKALTEHGELVCISVREDVLNELVYVARPNGYKYTSLWIKNTLECVLKMEQKIQDEEDCFFDDGIDNENLIYCFAVPNIPGEDVTTYVMQSVHMADSKAYAVYKEKLQETYRYICDHKDEIKREENKVETKDNGGCHVHQLPKKSLFGFLGLPWL